MQPKGWAGTGNCSRVHSRRVFGPSSCISARHPNFTHSVHLFGDPPPYAPLRGPRRAGCAPARAWGRGGRSGMPRRDAQLASHGSTAASSWPGTRVWYSRERTRYCTDILPHTWPALRAVRARCQPATSPPRRHGTTPKRVPVTERRRATEGKYQIPSTWVAHAGARGAESGRAQPRLYIVTPEA